MLPTKPRHLHLPVNKPSFLGVATVRAIQRRWTNETTPLWDQLAYVHYTEADQVVHVRERHRHKLYAPLKRTKADAKKPSVVMRCTFRPFIPRLPSAGERPDGLLTVVFGALTSWPGAGVRVRAACGAAVVLEELLEKRRDAKTAHLPVTDLRNLGADLIRLEAEDPTGCRRLRWQ